MIIRKVIYFLLYFWISLITTLSLIPSSNLPKTFVFPHIDKVVHFTFYLVLSILIFIRLSESIRFTKRTIITISLIFPITYSGIIEIIQEYVIPSRSGDWFDFLANSIGTVVGCLAIYYIFPKVSNFLIEKNRVR